MDLGIDRATAVGAQGTELTAAETEAQGQRGARRTGQSPSPRGPEPATGSPWESGWFGTAALGHEARLCLDAPRSGDSGPGSRQRGSGRPAGTRGGHSRPAASVRTQTSAESGCRRAARGRVRPGRKPCAGTQRARCVCAAPGHLEPKPAPAQIQTADPARPRNGAPRSRGPKVLSPCARATGTGRMRVGQGQGRALARSLPELGLIVFLGQPGPRRGLETRSQHCRSRPKPFSPSFS